MSLLTARAARVPSSMAPSMKLLQPTAQSELAKYMFPCGARRSSRCSVTRPGGEKNQAPLANSSSAQLWNTWSLVSMQSQSTRLISTYHSFNIHWSQCFECLHGLVDVFFWLDMVMRPAKSNDMSIAARSCSITDGIHQTVVGICDSTPRPQVAIAHFGMHLYTLVDVLAIRSFQFAWDQRWAEGDVLQDVHGDR
jgi:hypothetical protein